MGYNAITQDRMLNSYVPHWNLNKTTTYVALTLSQLLQPCFVLCGNIQLRCIFLFKSVSNVCQPSIFSPVVGLGPANSTWLACGVVSKVLRPASAMLHQGGRAQGWAQVPLGTLLPPKSFSGRSRTAFSNIQCKDKERARWSPGGGGVFLSPSGLIRSV